VVAVAAAQHTFTDALQALGTAQARESIVLTPKVADTIRAIRFESGDRVRRGQVLVEMSSVEQAADLAQARAANDAAQEELRRYQELFERGFASQARLDTVRAAADAAQARVNAGGSRIADRTIRAPFAGVVGLRTASPGQFMRPGDQIGTLDDISEIKLDFDVPETQIARLASGVQIIALTAAFPDRTFEGVISHVDSRVDPTTRTVRVRAMLPNQDEAIRPGMLMTVRVLANPRDALAIPEIAILDRADGASVYRVVSSDRGQAVEQVAIRTGQRSGGVVEVLEGLNAGDLVITEGVQSVRPGQPVRLGGGAEGAAEAPQPRPRG
jgi:membrane fusion protein (multidrug efflux system)